MALEGFPPPPPGRKVRESVPPVVMAPLALLDPFTYPVITVEAFVQNNERNAVVQSVDEVT